MKIPFFSVVIPLYNKGPHIQRALFSALNQSFSDFEIIVINDASTDNSLQKVKEVESKKVSIYHRDEPGPGGYAARNLGIKNAKGTYIALLDADDEWSTNHLNEMHKLIKKMPRAGVYSCGFYLKNGNVIKTNAYYNKYKHNKEHIVENYFEEARHGRHALQTSVVVVEKTKFLEAGLFPAGKCRRSGDIETWMRLALKNQIAWTPNLGATYHKDSVNMVTKTIPNFEFHYMYYSSKELLTGLEAERAVELKRYVNHIANNKILRSISLNVNEEEMMKAYYKEVDQGYYLFFQILKMIPSSILKPLYSFYRYLMIKFSKDQL